MSTRAKAVTRPGAPLGTVVESIRLHGPGLVRRYEFPTVRDSGVFAAFAASLLAELDMIPEADSADLNCVAALEGRTKEPR